MNKKLSRCLAIVLAAALTIMPITAYAATDGTACDTEQSADQSKSVHDYDYYAEEGNEKKSNDVFMADSVDDKERYTVLVLDTSGEHSFLWGGTVIYTAKTAIEYVRKAAISFVNSSEKHTKNHHIALVTFDDAGTIVSDFSENSDDLKEKINGITASGDVANIEDGLKKADELLSEITDENAIKNVVICNTGFVNGGSYRYTGRYDSSTVGSNWYRINTGVRLYAYANKAYEQAEVVKGKATIYSLGLFQPYDGMPDRGKDVAKFFRIVAADLASSRDYFYAVDDPEKLDFIFGDIAKDIIGYGEKFNYAGVIDGVKDSTARYYYDDKYFFDSAYNYNNSLATMSLCLELSTWSSHNYDAWYNPNLTETDDAFWKDKLVNIKTLLLGSPDETLAQDGYQGIGFKDFCANSFWEDKPGSDSIGVAAARKAIKDENTGKEYTLIALAVRGGGYGGEWASNFTMGESGEHQGFSEARDNVLEFLKNTYIPRIADDEPKDIKLWVTGYSRGAATANMVAGKLNAGFDINSSDSSFTLTPENIYCYTFETPMGATYETAAADGDKNVHNIINLNDVVPYVAPSAWNFTRYGYAHDRILPTKATDGNWNIESAAMKIELEKMGFDSNKWYSVEEVSTVPNLKIDKSRFLPGGEPLYWYEESKTETRIILKDAVDYLAQDALNNRDYYQKNLQEGVRQICYEFGSGTLEKDKLKASADKLLTKENFAYFLAPGFNIFRSAEKNAEEMKKRIVEKTKEAFSDYANNDGFIEAIVDIIDRALGKALVDAWNNDTDDVNTVLKLIDLAKAKDVEVDGEKITKGVGSLANAHYPEICMAWLRSQDELFNKSKEADSVNSGMTRVIHINCPVDVKVMDAENKIVAEIVDNEVTNQDGASALVNDDGEKIVYLPGNAEYQIVANATDKGEVYYSVNEYDFLSGEETRVVNFEKVEVERGNSLTGIVPEVKAAELSTVSENGSSTEYRLLDRYSNTVDCTEKSGDDIKKYNVTVEADGNGGYVFGNGNFVEGNFAKVEAELLPGGEFLGWYDGDELLSTDAEYRFPVYAEKHLTAKFNELATYDVKFKATEGGKVTNSDGKYSEGIEIQIEAKADEGYSFEKWELNGKGTISPNEVSSNAISANAIFTVGAGNAELTAVFKKDHVDFERVDLGNGYSLEYPTTLVFTGGKISGKALKPELKVFKGDTQVQIKTVQSKGGKDVTKGITIKGLKLQDGTKFKKLNVTVPLNAYAITESLIVSKKIKNDVVKSVKVTLSTGKTKTLKNGKDYSFEKTADGYKLTFKGNYSGCIVVK